MSIRVLEIIKNSFADVKTDLEVILQTETDVADFNVDYEMGFGSYKAILTKPYTAVSATTQSVGSGLDDATFSGVYLGDIDALITVTIDSEGTPDTFSWAINGVTQATGVSITAANALGNGLIITFLATTGHTDTDAWTAFYMIA